MQGRSPFVPISLAVVLTISAFVTAPGGGQRARDTVRVPAGPPAWGSSVTLTALQRIGALDGPPEYA